VTTARGGRCANNRRSATPIRHTSGRDRIRTGSADDRVSTCCVSTFDGQPYVAPFSGNIIELCPGGALTSQPSVLAYRLSELYHWRAGAEICSLLEYKGGSAESLLR
jgi:hypothetical protein